jgi:hypothetical protein
LLDGADLPADGLAVIVGEGERDALVGERARAGQLLPGDPAVCVGIGNRVGVAHPRRRRPRDRGPRRGSRAAPPAAAPS